ncbi:MAG TPA: hypothetical protein VFT02_10650, partial [Pyrinomonadaceae bacterium]|nr:hypothetical protein [Pyrinomonadaceae bacterium]
MNTLLLRLAKVGMLLGILTILCGTVLAHDPGLSAVEVRILENRIVAEVSFSPLDLDKIQPVDANLLTVEDDQGKLELRSFSRNSPDQNSVHFQLEFSSSKAAKLRISAPVLANLPRGHKQFCSVYDRQNSVLAERMLSAESKEFTIDVQASPANNRSFGRFL